MNTNNTSTSCTAKPVSPDPEKQLEILKLKLQEKEAALASGTEEVKSLREDLKARQAKIAEVRQLLTGYDAQKLQRQLNDDNKVITTKSGIADAALKDKKTVIDTAIKMFDEKLYAQGRDVDTARTNCMKADEETKAAVDAAETARRTFEESKNIPIKFDAWLKDTKAALDQAIKAETQGDYVALYFLTGEAQQIVDKFKADPILSDDEYKNSLDAKLSDSDTTRENVNAKKAIADQALKDLNEKAKNYDAAKASRRTELLSILKKL